MRTQFSCIVFAVALWCGQASAQSGWFFQSPLPTVASLRSVCFTDAKNGTAVGGPGAILRTTDGGNNWVRQSSGLASEGGYIFNGVYFTDVNTGWVVAHPGIILKTTDAGSNWIRKYYAGSEGDNLGGVYFIDSDTGYVVGTGYVGGNCGGKVLKTTDGGESWNGRLTDSNVLNGIYFTDANTGTAVGDRSLGGSSWAGTILRTTDGGVNWIVQARDLASPPGDVYFLDANTGWIPCGDRLLRTTNGGENWVPQLIDSTISFLSLGSVCFTDRSTGTVVGDGWNVGIHDVFIYRTTNGGTTWVRNSVGMVAAWAGLADVCFADADSGIAVGGCPSMGKNVDGPIMVRTTDGGISWFSQIKGTHYELDGVFFVDANIGTAVGNNGTIIRTSDGGNSWIRQSSGTLLKLCDVSFADANTGLAVGGDWYDQGIVLRTTNGGNSWVTQLEDSAGRFNGVYLIDVNTGWVVGGNKILKTSDGGENWVVQMIDPNYGIEGNIGFNEVQFTDARTGTVVGGDGYSVEGVVLRTTNGGDSWVKQPYGKNYGLKSVYFTSSTTGWIVGSGSGGGKILKTTDGGNSWTEQISGTAAGLNSVCFTSSATGWAVGEDMGSAGGVILQTTDGGDSWTEQTRVTMDGLNAVCFTTSTTGWAVGYQGIVLKTTNGGVTFVEAKEIAETPTAFSLRQNFPNPFNPSTTIRFELPKASHASLTVYDMLGRQVSALVNERKAPGSYEVKFDGSGLASGVYFYRLQAGGFVSTKRMLVLK